MKGSSIAEKMYQKKEERGAFSQNSGVSHCEKRIFFWIFIFSFSFSLLIFLAMLQKFMNGTMIVMLQYSYFNIIHDPYFNLNFSTPFQIISYYRCQIRIPYLKITTQNMRVHSYLHTWYSSGEQKTWTFDWRRMRLSEKGRPAHLCTQEYMWDSNSR